MGKNRAGVPNNLNTVSAAYILWVLGFKRCIIDDLFRPVANSSKEPGV